MSQRDDLNRLRHMLDHALEAAEMVQGKTRSDLDRDRQLNLALVRLLEIVGEAASKVSNEFCAQHPSIPWIQISGLRNRLIHGYDAVDYDIVWEIVHHDLPRLIPNLRAILKKR